MNIAITRVVSLVICIYLFSAIALSASPATSPSTTLPSTAPTGISDALWARMKSIDAKAGDIHDLSADFVQKKFTPLLKDPIVSKGTLLGKGAVMLWKTTSPRPTMMRVDGQQIAIYYPEEKTEEIYDLGGQMSSMTASPIPRLSALIDHFAFVPAGAEDFEHIGSNELAFKLTPIDKQIREHVETVLVKIDVNHGYIVEFSLTDIDGETTVLNFTNVKLNAGVSDAQLTLNVPAGTKVSRPLQGASGDDGPPKQSIEVVDMSEEIMQLTPTQIQDVSMAGVSVQNAPTTRELPVATSMEKTTLAPAAPGAFSRFWLRKLFALSAKAPWLLRAIKPAAVWGTVAVSSSIRHATRANARRIFNRTISSRTGRAFARRVVGQFYDFVIETAQSDRLSQTDLRLRIEAIENHDSYTATRARGNGAIILTAHLGSFESGLAALSDVEPHIHVVFKRDAMAGFEMMRQSLRKTLGIVEAAIDDGWQTWMRLRDALLANEVVVMQGDRAMPGQKFCSVPVLGGTLALPIGPFKLAQLSGSPIIPVFAVRLPSGRCRVISEPAICVDNLLSVPGADGIDPGVWQWSRVLEKYISAYPDQWLMLEPAFVEDRTMPIASA